MVSNIWVAAADNQVKIVESYLDSGDFTPNSKDPNGYTPIHAAASYGHIGLLKLLIKRGGNINIQDSEGDAPLHHVEDLRTAKVMVEELKADWKIKNNEGQIPAEYIEEDDEFPELAQYLRSLSHDQPQSTGVSGDETLASLPAPGNIDGHQIRYTMENEVPSQEESFDDEERRKKIELILNSENPEEALRDLVRSAVHEGMSKYKSEQEFQDEEAPSSKKRKD
ncbi:Ankyrin repeat-containing protein [Debaryomyces fabryi]|uniref:Ankyrin repeat-containing protein n=1 Tax=Debaryomyces fabryi TaxID=58627 RepID=A0A0V1Q592_9ASCO|nr:Ankyrin repeat-containing protein [Debaryomyces fabryi]KSA03681.1 Ankyrin repeat-containing protein [Debaryomyces fabryi]CUM53464.1 unnamed protein product [Debaryomyces fabryi]